MVGLNCVRLINKVAIGVVVPDRFEISAAGVIGQAFKTKKK